MKILMILVVLLFISCTETNNNENKSCSSNNLTGECESGKICQNGKCIDSSDSRVELENKITEKLNSFDTDTDFTLLIKDKKGRIFKYSKGNSTANTFYRSASTSKLISATIILDFVKKGILSLDDHPQKYISFWPTEGNLSKITLQHLLSFTSGLKNSPLCINSPNFDFTQCVKNIISKNIDAKLPGIEFNYGSSHLQVAGLMVINASSFNSWNEIFQAFKSENNIFKESNYDLPSVTNPRLAGGMHWNANEYLEFLENLYNGKLLTEELRSKMFSDQLNGAIPIDSPARAIGEDWHYGFGNWIECHSTSYNCSETTKVSSPGLYGAYPFIDFKNEYFGILSREGGNNTFAKGYNIFAHIAPELEEWANLK